MDRLKIYKFELEDLSYFYNIAESSSDEWYNSKLNPYSFPSDWFIENPGKKPTIDVSYSQDKPGLRESLVRSLYTEISLKHINIEHAITFLYIYAKDTMKESLNEDWKSYSLTIGLKGSVITPMNIIDANLKDFSFENLKDRNVELPSSDDWLVFYLCTLYRLSKEPSAGKHEKIANIGIRHSAIRALDFNVINERELSSDYNYRALIAAYDMFLHKFRKNSAKFCRTGTSESRLRDCAALSSYLKACKCLGIKNIKDLAKWSTFARLERDYMRLLFEKEEYSNEHSYFIYQMDFRLTKRSAYSAYVNRCAHFFCNIIAGLCLDERGLRAKKIYTIICKDHIRMIVKNALLIAYAYREQTLGDKPDELEPKSKDAEEWKHFMQTREWKLTDNMINWFENRRTKIGHTNPKTVGEVLKNTIFLTAN